MQLCSWNFSPLIRSSCQQVPIPPAGEGLPSNTWISAIMADKGSQEHQCHVESHPPKVYESGILLANMLFFIWSRCIEICLINVKSKYNHRYPYKEREICADPEERTLWRLSRNWTDVITSQGMPKVVSSSPKLGGSRKDPHHSLPRMDGPTDTLP